MALLDILRSAAPSLATALGGPLAGAAVSFVAGKMGLPEASQERVQEALAGTDPAKMRELELDFQKFMADNGIKLDLAQLDVDKTEATSTNWFVAGWRPFVGWVCGLGLSYVAIIEPVARFVATVWFHYTGAFPAIDTTLTMQVLLGMLGLGAMRSVEKVKDAEGNR